MPVGRTALICLCCFLAPNHVVPVRAQPTAPETKYAKEFYFDFRGKPLPDELAVVGKESDSFVKPEPQGLRVRLPAERESFFPVGVATQFSVQGDFEITATVEVLQADVPKKGFGVGATLYINKVEPTTEGTNLGRLMRPGGDRIMWDRRYDNVGDKPKFAGGDEPCTDKLVRLRLRRSGAQLAYLWAVGAEGGEFKKLTQNHFGDDDVKQVSLRAATGQQPLSVDVRLIDLRIRSAGATALPPVAVAALPPASSAPGTPPPRTWLVAVLLTGLALLLVFFLGLAAWILLLRRRAPAAATANPLSFACPKCDRTLQVGPDLAGKKVKCKKCGTIVPVPAT
jgi:hypothetical protein